IRDCFHVTDNTDDSEPRPRAIEPSPFYPLTDRVLSRPKTVREGFAHNADLRRIPLVTVGEVAPLKEWVHHRFEVTWWYRAQISEMKATRLGRRRALGVTTDQVERSRHRRSLAHGGRGYAGN